MNGNARNVGTEGGGLWVCVAALQCALQRAIRMGMANAREMSVRETADSEMIGRQHKC